MKQRSAVLEVELKEIAHQLTIERQLSTKLHDQVRTLHNITYIPTYLHTDVLYSTYKRL